MEKYTSSFKLTSIWCMLISNVAWLYIVFDIWDFVICLYVALFIPSIGVFYVLCGKRKIKDVQSINHYLTDGHCLYFIWPLLCFYLHEISQTLFVLFVMYQVTLLQIGNQFRLNGMNLTYIKGNHSSRKHEIEHECSPSAHFTGLDDIEAEAAMSQAIFWNAFY